MGSVPFPIKSAVDLIRLAPDSVGRVRMGAESFHPWGGGSPEPENPLNPKETRRTFFQGDPTSMTGRVIMACKGTTYS